jgi:hypothetical protein
MSALPAKPTGLTVSEIANRIRRRNTRIVEDVISNGNDLSKAKAQLDHGEWLRWLDREFDWTDRTAQSYMRLAEMAKTKSISDFARLPLSGLYLLAAPSTPETVRDEIINDTAGQQITVAYIKHRIKAARSTGSPDDDAEAGEKINAREVEERTRARLAQAEAESVRHAAAIAAAIEAPPVKTLPTPPVPRAALDADYSFPELIDFVEFCRTHSPTLVIECLSGHERDAFRRAVDVASAWFEAAKSKLRSSFV